MVVYRKYRRKIMRKFLMLTAGILCVAGSSFAADEIKTDVESSQVIDMQGLPKAQNPDIENRLVAKKEVVHAKVETKKSELGVEKDVTLSSLGISETKVYAPSEAVKQAQKANTKTEEEHKAPEAEAKADDEVREESDELDAATDKEIDNIKEEVVDAEDEPITVNEDVDKADEKITETENPAVAENENAEVKDVEEENVVEEVSGTEEPVVENNEADSTPEKADDVAKDGESAFDELDNMF